MRVHFLLVPYDSGHREWRMGRGPSHLLRHGAGSTLRAMGHDVEAGGGMISILDILRCPVTKGNLRLDGASLSSGEKSYPLVDGIPVLLPEKVSTSSSIIEYYDQFGWEAESDGKSKESAHELDRRDTSYRYTGRCISRL